MSAEIKVYCIQSRKNAVAQHLRESIHNGDSSMFSEYLNTEDRCEYSLYPHSKCFFCHDKKR